MSDLDAFGLWIPDLIFYGVLETWESCEKLLGARGFILIEYEPMHGEPWRPQDANP